MSWVDSIICCVFQGVFRITTKENTEYLLQAANEEEREDWTTAIANAVRRLDIKYKVSLSLRKINTTYLISSIYTGVRSQNCLRSQNWGDN